MAGWNSHDAPCSHIYYIGFLEMHIFDWVLCQICVWYENISLYNCSQITHVGYSISCVGVRSGYQNFLLKKGWIDIRVAWITKNTGLIPVEFY